MTSTPKSRNNSSQRNVGKRVADANRVLTGLPGRSSGRSLRPTVRVCPVDPPLRSLAVLAAATRTLVTTYTSPGHRVLLVEPTVVARAAGSPRRPSPIQAEWASVVEATTRLGRGASTCPSSTQFDPAVPHTAQIDDSAIEAAAELDDPDRTLPIPAEFIAALDRFESRADQFDLIIAVAGATHPGHSSVAAWACRLTSTGTLALITHSDRTYGQLAGPGRDIERAARLAGLTLIDKLILLHETPPPLTAIAETDRTAVATTGHRRIHSEVLVLTPQILDNGTEHHHV